MAEDAAFAVGNVVFADAATAQRWDGQQWGHLGLLPHPPERAASDRRRFVEDVDGRSHDDVWAVGTVTYFGLTGVVALPATWHWDGIQWSYFAAHAYSDEWNMLKSVCARSEDATWTVGFAKRARHPYLVTLTERWDGQRWAHVESPNIDGGGNQLFAVAASAPDDVLAVGGFWNLPNAIYWPLTMHWDGRAWKLIEIQLRDSSLYGVAAISKGDAWAVGARAREPNVNEPLAVHWDGSSWQETAVPSLTSDGVFWDVAATGTDDVWAVGMQRTAQWLPHTLIAHWDGSAWSIINSPNVVVPGGGYLTGSQHFKSASAHSGITWAAGSFVDAMSTLEPLIATTAT